MKNWNSRRCLRVSESSSVVTVVLPRSSAGDFVKVSLIIRNKNKQFDSEKNRFTGGGLLFWLVPILILQNFVTEVVVKICFCYIFCH